MNTNPILSNPLFLDGIVAAVLLAAALVKASKGLYKSLMPLVVTIAAVVCAFFLSSALSTPVTDAVYPLVEDSVLSAIDLDELPDLSLDELAELPEELADKVFEALPPEIAPLLSRLGLDVKTFLSEAVETVRSTDAVQKLLTDEQLDKLESVGVEIKSAAGTVTDAVKQTVDTDAVVYSAIFSLTYRLTHLFVRFLLWCILCIALLVVFTIISNALGLTFKLPVIGWVDKLGGAVLGLVECGLVLFVLGWLLSFFGVPTLHEMSEGTRLCALFF